MIDTILLLRDRDSCLHGYKNEIKDVMANQRYTSIIYYYMADSVDCGLYQRDRKNDYIWPSAVFISSDKRSLTRL